MKTDHITHVVLYAKNFYVHTGNVVKDMQRFMQLDGHKYGTINTPEKVVKEMRKDFLIWVQSMGNERDVKYLSEWANGTVAWEDGCAGEIWHMLIPYSGNHIPMDSAFVGHPIYDKYHLPQKTNRTINFSSCKSFEDMMDVAAKFIDRTQEERLDIHANDLLNRIKFNKISKFLHDFKGIDMSVDALKDEFWESYEKFMDDNLNEDHTVSGNHTVYSPNFITSYTCKNRSVDITINNLLKTYTVEVPYADGNQTTKEKLFEDALKFIPDIVEHATAYNNIIPDSFYECTTDPNEVARVFNDMVNDKNLSFDADNGGVGTGGYMFELSNNDGIARLDIHLIGSFECSIEEGELLSKSCFTADERW